MVKPNNWETIEPDYGDYEKLPAGGYVCRIVAVQATTSNAGNEMLVIYLDIAEGTHTGRFMKQYRTRKEYEEQPKWSNAATFRQLTSGEYVSRFKGFIKTIEKSNPGFVWNWDEKKLEDLRFGGIFREEEYLDNKGNLRTATKIYRIVPIEGLADRPIPTKKPLAESKNNSPFNADATEDIPF